MPSDPRAARSFWSLIEYYGKEQNNRKAEKMAANKLKSLRR